jgi:high-affinity Fe2+/Pb2+ permease
LSARKKVLLRMFSASPKSPKSPCSRTTFSITAFKRESTLFFEKLFGDRPHMPRYSLETIILILIVLWLLGAFVMPIGGGLIHLLLVIILIVVVIRLLQGRGPLP